MPRLLTALTALALLVLLVPASAGAAKRSVPQGFYAVNWDSEISENAPAALEDQEWARMARSGVEATRTSFVWATAQPEPNGPINFTRTDRVVTLATRHGIELLPIVILAPPWARLNGADFSPPRNPDEYAAYVTALVRRYGPAGSFWAEHPELKKKPLRKWQMWNEPHLGFQWSDGPGEDYAPAYGALLRASYRAVHAADRGASVVLAGLSNYSWRYLEELYKRGRIRGYYDIAAVHPYTRTASGVVEIAKRFRGVMAKRGDGRKRLWITELGLPASRGREESNSRLQTTDSGMAKFLSDSFATVAKTRRSRSVGVGRVYWYTWASVYCCEIFRYTGLLAYDNRSTVKARPAHRAYVRSARRAQGCVKTSSGACR